MRVYGWREIHVRRERREAVKLALLLLAGAVSVALGVWS
jgi:hypothetical protein